MKKGRIIIVDDNRNVLSALKIFLQAYFEEVTTLPGPNTLTSALREIQPDVVLLDMNFSAGINSGNEGLYWLAQIKKSEPDIPVVLFTAYADIDLAVRALKEGATDFIVKPWDNTKLLATLTSAMELHNSRKEVRMLKERRRAIARSAGSEEDIFWGNSRPMRELLAMVEKVAATDANVLLTGENGTGKEVIARHIHNLSNRASEVLVTVDMGAITDTLFESELFGHVKGAFTDAKSDRAGKFEAADKGTLFLDEIGNLGYPQQSKLLAALQSRQVTRVGSNTPVPVDIRLISATNRDPDAMVKAGELREDLLYRINTIHLEVPSLRDRRDDIRGLAEFFLRRYGAKYGKGGIALSDAAAEKLGNYGWPGNVRELQHAVEKAVILADSELLQPADFYFKTTEERYEIMKSLSLEEMERVFIRKVIADNDGNLSESARQLGITRPTLYSKMKKYGL